MNASGEAEIVLLGFGEAGQAFAGGWPQDVRSKVVTYDIKLSDPAKRGQITEACARIGIDFAENLSVALEASHHIFSLVTADRAYEAASQAAQHIRPGGYYLDCNSCSPATKKASEAKIVEAGGLYIDVAVMAPVAPKLHRTPLLISGSHAEEACTWFETLDMNPSVVGSHVGQASAIKMLRSVMIKGLEALTAECMLAARRAGVDDAVLASLQASDPGWDWLGRSAYNLERMMVHGERRAAEMDEVANTIVELGLPDRMARATATWQRELAALRLEGGANSLASRADRILQRLEP
ncbi:3-hydroxyisobutyrate dehydrogenase [Rhizobium sp. ACO-34A]|nr:NAD(P)-dependent oxidoreductase [Rhizobium sp. ACO-34A]ATN32807.1 3-hydroxyisobutyrate dehydrogenase [Rhizobium sp. ACO-34A]